MTAAEWRVGIISFFPSARMQRSDLASDRHSHYKYKPELDTLHLRIEDEMRLADIFGGAPPVSKGRPGIYSRCSEGALVGRPAANLLPELTPVYLTFTMALELATAASRSSSTFRADPVQDELETTSALALNLLNRINAIYHLSHRTGRSASIVPDAFPVPKMQRQGA